VLLLFQLFKTLQKALPPKHQSGEVECHVKFLKIGVPQNHYFCHEKGHYVNFLGGHILKENLRMSMSILQMIHAISVHLSYLQNKEGHPQANWMAAKSRTVYTI
jgi:hypothetical protein